MVAQRITGTGFMNGAEVLDVGREAIVVLLKMAGPFMIIALVVGLVIALFQALTQVQEMTLVFVPKIFAIFITLLVMLPYMGSTISSLMTIIFDKIVSG
jgi:flagellar biosynthetic protein FliQ